MTDSRPATAAQRSYVAGLLDTRRVGSALRSQTDAAFRDGLTRSDAEALIPKLLLCPSTGKHFLEDNYSSPNDWGDENPGYASPENPTGY